MSVAHGLVMSSKKSIVWVWISGESGLERPRVVEPEAVLKNRTVHVMEIGEGHLQRK